MQKACLQELHKRLSLFKKRMLGMCGQHQDRTWRYEERRRDLLADKVTT